MTTPQSDAAKKNAPEVFPARRGYRVARYSGKIISDLIYTPFLISAQ